MYRGLTARQHVADRFGLGRNAFNATSTTSNAEYGGWFSHGSVTRPAFARAKSDTIWRNGAAIPTNIEELLRQTDSVASSAVQSNSLTQMNNKSFDQVAHSGGDARPTADEVNRPATSVQENGKRFEMSGEPNGIHEIPNQRFERHQSISLEDQSSPSFDNQFSMSNAALKPTKYTTQRSYNYQMPSPRSQLQSNQLQLKKSATTLDILSDGSEQSVPLATYQNTPYAKQGLNNTSANIKMSRNISGTGPSWQNRWSQNRTQYTGPPNRQDRAAAEHQIMPLSVEALATRSDASSVSKSTDVSNPSERVTNHETMAQTTVRNDEMTKGAEVNRFREDRSSNSEKVNAKQEKVTEFDLQTGHTRTYKLDLQTGLTRQKQDLYQHLGDEGKQTQRRYGSVAVLNMNSITPTAARQSKPGLPTESFRNLNGTRSGFSLGLLQPKAQTRGNIYSDSTISTRTTPRDATMAVSDNRYSTCSDFSAAPKKSILKKPKCFSNDPENRLYSRRADVVLNSYSAPVQCFNGGNSHASSFSNRQQDLNQKRVTFNLIQ